VPLVGAAVGAAWTADTVADALGTDDVEALAVGAGALVAAAFVVAVAAAVCVGLGVGGAATVGVAAGGSPPGAWIVAGGGYVVGAGTEIVTVKVVLASTGEPERVVCVAERVSSPGRTVPGSRMNVVNRPAASTDTPPSTKSAPAEIATGLHGAGQKPRPVTRSVVSGGP
jgi:hypothetical protein